MIDRRILYLGGRRIWLVEACFADPPASESRRKASLNPAGRLVGLPVHGSCHGRRHESLMSSLLVILIL
jgi:hypothetical protein